jgi:hypothetical protein
MTNVRARHTRRSRLDRALRSAAATGCALALSSGCATASPSTPAASREEIYVLRSIHEPSNPVADWCFSARTGFEPFPTNAERFFSFWSVESRPGDGRIVETKVARVAELRGCFGPTSERARQNFDAEIRLGSVTLHGTGECLAVGLDVPQVGLFPVRCQLILGGAPAPYVGGLLTTNTMTSRAAFGGESDPPGYTQASIATIRLWKDR